MDIKKACIRATEVEHLGSIVTARIIKNDENEITRNLAANATRNSIIL